MDLGRPLRTVTPTLEADVLGLLARADIELTGRQVARAIDASHSGTRQALLRLVGSGVVIQRGAGRALTYRLNREHLAAAAIEDLAHLRLELLSRLRAELAGWATKPFTAALFGSVARGEAGPASDIDVLVIRPATVDADDVRWRDQLAELQERCARWTGNDTRVLEIAESELGAIPLEPVLSAALSEGIDLAGASLAALRREVRGSA